MMRRTRFYGLTWIVVAAMSILTAPAVPALARTAAVVEIAWVDIVRAVDAHPAVAAGNLRVDAARGAVQAAGAVPNLTVEGTVGHGIEKAGGSGVEWGLSLTMPFDWIARRGPGIAAAAAGVDEAMAEADALRRDVLSRLRVMFWDLLFRQESVASLAELMDETAALADAVKKRVESGEIRPVELTRIEIELQKVAAELDTARFSLAAGQIDLALWLGLAPGLAPVATADPSALPDVPDLESALAAVRAAHPLLAAGRAREQALQAEAAGEKQARIPGFSVTGFTESELDKRGWGVGLALELPLWNWNRGGIARSEADLAAGRRQSEADAMDLEISVVDAQASCSSSVATARRFRDEVVPRSRTVATTMEKTYLLGETGLLELIDARRTLLDSRRAALLAQAQARIECSRLDGLMGEESR